MMWEYRVALAVTTKCLLYHSQCVRRADFAESFAGHFFLSRLITNRSTETITIVGPTVDVFKISVLIRNPTATETKLTANARTTNWAILPVSWRAVAAGMMIKALESNPPIKRRPTKYSEAEHEHEPKVQARHVHSGCSSQLGREKIQDQSIFHASKEGDNQNDGCRPEKETGK